MLAGTAAVAACEDPTRPVPGTVGATLFVDSEPQGGRIFIDDVDTGEETPALIDPVAAGARRVRVELDTAGLTYTYAAFVVVDPTLEASVSLPVTIRCSNPLCLREAAQFHSAGNIRFAVNGAGPLFVYEGLDAGIVWPATTQNTYASLGAATITSFVNSDPVALGLRNVSGPANYWSGRPAPRVTGGDPYRVTVPSWLLPAVAEQGRLRGIEVVHEVIGIATTPDLLVIRVTWKNITTDSLYRSLDPTTPTAGLTYADAYLGFILDVDVGAFAESDDDLVSYSADRNLVFMYDAALAVPGFSGGWSARPGMVGLMQIDGPGESVRLNAWPRAMDFVSGQTDAAGRALLTAQQTNPADHPDPRIGYAPDATLADYLMSVTSGPITLAPGDSASASFAVLLAAPVTGTYVSGQLLPAGDPADPNRPLAATAGRLLEMADSLLAQPPASSSP